MGSDGNRSRHRSLRRHEAIVGALLAATAAQAGAMDVLHRERSLYRNIVIYEDDGLRCMAFGRNTNMRQSCTALSAPSELVFNYAKLVYGAFYLAPNPQRILVVGLGGGSLAMALQRTFPDAAIDAVEIDPAVVRMARQYFAFIPGSKMRVFEEDGRVYIKRAMRTSTRYDVIVLDAYDHDYIPEHMLTLEFLREARTLLSPGGVLAGNTFTSSKLYDSESATYHAALGEFYTLKTNNRVILARPDGLPPQAELARNADLLEPRLRLVGVEKSFVLPRIEILRDWSADARVLTDQHSPANLLNLAR